MNCIARSSVMSFAGIKEGAHGPASVRKHAIGNGPVDDIHRGSLRTVGRKTPRRRTFAAETSRNLRSKFPAERSIVSVSSALALSGSKPRSSASLMRCDFKSHPSRSFISRVVPLWEGYGPPDSRGRLPHMYRGTGAGRAVTTYGWVKSQNGNFGVFICCGGFPFGG